MIVGWWQHRVRPDCRLAGRDSHHRRRRRAIGAAAGVQPSSWRRVHVYVCLAGVVAAGAFSVSIRSVRGAMVAAALPAGRPPAVW
jgi:hypothetical protein